MAEAQPPPRRWNAGVSQSASASSDAGVVAPTRASSIEVRRERPTASRCLRPRDLPQSRARSPRLAVRTRSALRVARAVCCARQGKVRTFGFVGERCACTAREREPVAAGATYCRRASGRSRARREVGEVGVRVCVCADSYLDDPDLLRVDSALGRWLRGRWMMAQGRDGWRTAFVSRLARASQGARRAAIALLALLAFVAPTACSSPDGPMESPRSNTASEVIWGNANLKNFENVSTLAHQEYGTAVGLMANRSQLNSTAFNCPVPPTATDCTWIMSTTPSGLCAGSSSAPSASCQPRRARRS